MESVALQTLVAVAIFALAAVVAFFLKSSGEGVADPAADVMSFGGPWG